VTRSAANWSLDQLAAYVAVLSGNGISTAGCRLKTVPVGGKYMKNTVGLWIDHRKAVIVLLSDKGEKTTVIESKVERQQGRFEGKRSVDPYEARMVPADDSRERKYTGQLQGFYDQIISVIRDADSILLFGPGEAKGELKKRLEKDKLGARIEAVETEDAMTDRQIAAKVREYFHRKEG
jgi:hypothetical protein